VKFISDVKRMVLYMNSQLSAINIKIFKFIALFHLTPTSSGAIVVTIAMRCIAHTRNHRGGWNHV